MIRCHEYNSLERSIVHVGKYKHVHVNSILKTEGLTRRFGTLTAVDKLAVNNCDQNVDYVVAGYRGRG